MAVTVVDGSASGAADLTVGVANEHEADYIMIEKISLYLKISKDIII